VTRPINAVFRVMFLFPASNNGEHQTKWKVLGDQSTVPPSALGGCEDRSRAGHELWERDPLHISNVQRLVSSNE